MVFTRPRYLPSCDSKRGEDGPGFSRLYEPGKHESCELGAKCMLLWKPEIKPEMGKLYRACCPPHRGLPGLKRRGRGGGKGFEKRARILIGQAKAPAFFPGAYHPSALRAPPKGRIGLGAPRESRDLAPNSYGSCSKAKAITGKYIHYFYCIQRIPAHRA